MNILFGFVFLYFSYSYLKNAINPSKLSRLSVQVMCATLSALALLMSAIQFLGGGAGG